MSNLRGHIGLILGLFFLSQPVAWGHGGATSSSGASDNGTMLNSPVASTLNEGESFVGFDFRQEIYNSHAAINAHRLHEDGRDIHGLDHEEFYTVLFGLGIMENLDLTLVVPIASKTFIQISDEDNVGRKEGSEGLGDISLVSKYRFWRGDIEGSLIAGVKLPTGESSNKDKSDKKIEPELQPGSGSWDGEFGIVFSKSVDEKWFLSTAFEYHLNGEGAMDRKFGDVIRHSIGASYKPAENTTLVLELNTEWTEKDRARNDDAVFDSGGTAIFLSPGIMVDVTDDLSAYFAIPVPVYQNLGGEHEELKYQLIAGMSYQY